LADDDGGVPGVLAILAATTGLPSARADVYMWVDASGTTNVSNLAPPEGVRVTRVVTLPKTPRRRGRPRAARRAGQALSERVARQDELEQSRREASRMPAACRASGGLAPPAQYPSGRRRGAYVAEALTPAIGCYFPWTNCGIGWGAWPRADGRRDREGLTVTAAVDPHGTRPTFRVRPDRYARSGAPPQLSGPRGPRARGA
jgi:hypothetical protein